METTIKSKEKGVTYGKYNDFNRVYYLDVFIYFNIGSTVMHTIKSQISQLLQQVRLTHKERKIITYQMERLQPVKCLILLTYLQNLQAQQLENDVSIPKNLIN